MRRGDELERSFVSDADSHEPTAMFEMPEASSSIRALALPDVIDGRYRIVGRVGAGGMGIVLRAEDLFLARPVAIKILEPSADPAAGQRFVKEAQALAQVRHENVVQVYAFGPFQLSSYLAMELVVGAPLDSIIDGYECRRTTMELPRAMSILRAVARGLDAVHARKLVHRDVKPGNIIIETGTDRPVLIDFGLARRRSASSPKLSITGGTPSYMAPEQVRDPDGTRVSARSDLYAFGCVAFELLAGRPVFEGADVFTMLTAHLSEEPRLLSSLRPELAPMDRVLRKALAKDPEHRHASVGAMMAALDAAFARVVDGSEAAPSSVADEFTGLRTLVFAADESLRRSLVRNTTSTMRSQGRALRCEIASSVEQAAQVLTTTKFDLVVIDEESAGGRVAELVRHAYAKNAAADLVVVSRDFPNLTRILGESRVRHLVPKPVNVHVLAAVLGRLSAPPSTR